MLSLLNKINKSLKPEKFKVKTRSNTSNKSNKNVLFDTGRKHGVSKIYIEIPKPTLYQGNYLRELRALKGIGNVRKIKNDNI